MGRFDEFVGGAKDDQSEPVPSVALPPTAGRFDEFIGATPPAATPAVDWSRYNQPFGELKKDDPSPSERLKQIGQDAFIAAGAEPYRARHLSEAATGIASLNPVLGGAMSGADLTYNLPRGNYGHAAFDALGALPGALAVKRLKSGMPTVPMADAPMPPENLAAAKSAYRDTRYFPVEYHPLTAPDFTSKAQQALQHPELGFSPEKAPLTYATLNRWGAAMSARGTPITPSDWDTLRQQVRGLEGPDGAAGGHVANWIDRYMVNAPPAALVRGTPADLGDLANTFEVARGNYRAGKTGETVAKEIDRSGTRAQGRNSGLNVGNTTQQRLTALTTTDAGESKLFGARPDEIAAINRVGQDWLTNKARNWSNHLGGGGGAGNSGIGYMAGSGATALGGLMGLDPLTSVGLGVGAGFGTAKAGTALRGVANERTVKAADDVVKLIGRNSPEYAARARAAPDIIDPYAMQRDAVAYAMLPQLSQAAGSAWDRAHVPYDNRDQQ